jgi:hypothetical protein
MKRFLEQWIKDNKKELEKLGDLINQDNILTLHALGIEGKLRQTKELQWASYNFNETSFEIFCSGYGTLFKYDYISQEYFVKNNDVIDMVLKALVSNSIEDIINAIIKYNEEKTKQTKNIYWLKNYFDENDLNKIDAIHECSNPSHWAHGDNYFIFRYKGKVIHFESYDSGAYSGYHKNQIQVFRVIDKNTNGYGYTSPTIKNISPNNVGLKTQFTPFGTNIIGGKIDLNLLEKELL